MTWNWPDYFKYLEGSVDPKVNDMHEIKPRWTNHKVIRPTASFVKNKFDGIIDEINTKLNQAGQGPNYFDKNEKEDRRMLGELVIRYVNNYDDLYQSEDIKLEDVTLKEEDENIWEQRHGEPGYNVKKAALYIKYIFIALIVSFLILSAVFYFMDNDDYDDEMDYLHYAALIFEVLAFFGFSYVLIKAFKPGKNGFYQISDPVDMFIAMFSGILLFVLAIRTIIEILIDVSGNDDDDD